MYIVTCVHTSKLTCTHTHTRAPVWGRSPTSTLVLWAGSQGVPEVARFALVTVDTGRVVDALETPARQAVTVPGGAGVHVVVTLTGLTRPHWAPFPKGVPEVAVSTELTAGTSDPEGTVVAHDLLCLRHHGAAEPIAAGARLAAAGVVRVIVEAEGAVSALDVGVLVP